MLFHFWRKFSEVRSFTVNLQFQRK